MEPTDRLDQLLLLLEDSPSDPFLLFALAKEYEKTGQRTASFQYFNQLIAEHPDYVGTYYHLAKLHEAEGQSSEALTIYQNGIATARRVGDQHALSELMTAKMNLEVEEE